MNQFILRFDNVVLELERSNSWKSAAEQVYGQWKNDPHNISRLICAGTEIWYARLVVDYYKQAPEDAFDFTSMAETCRLDQLEIMLWDVVSYGEEHFSEDANFNAYFGYMYQVMPYFFIGYQGDYDGWQQRGRYMMRKAAALDPKNLFAIAMLHEIDSGSSQYRQACKELWAQITPEQWGSSRVQQYFFRILNGLMYYPDAYSM